MQKGEVIFTDGRIVVQEDSGVVVPNNSVIIEMGGVSTWLLREEAFSLAIAILKQLLKGEIWKEA